MPEQRYDEYRGLMVRPGLPTAYVPPVYAPAPPSGRHRAQGPPHGPAPQFPQHADPQHATPQQTQPQQTQPHRTLPQHAQPQPVPYAQHPQYAQQSTYPPRARYAPPRSRDGRPGGPGPGSASVPAAPAPAPAPPPAPTARTGSAATARPARHRRVPDDLGQRADACRPDPQRADPYPPGPPRPGTGDTAPPDTYRPSYEQAAARPEGGRAALRRAARERKAAQRPEALRRLVPQALVVAFLAGGTSAFVAHDKEVRLSVDGTPRTLHTFADDVGELLADEGVELGEHDHVGPSPERPLADGDEVAFSHGRPLDLTLDGTRRRVWTTARTVQDALQRMGVRTRGAALSLTPSAEIPRSGLRLEVLTERTVTFLADGHEKSLRTNAGTVLEALTEAGIELGGLDTTSSPLDSFPRDGQTITVMRIIGSEKVKEERIPFKTVRHADPRLPQGTEVVAREGRPGLRRVTYRLRTVNGVRQKPRRIAVEVLRHPRRQIIRVGTLPLPQSVPGADHLNWTALAQCESGGRPGAVDATGHHGGLYQFDTPTWHALGGSGRPQQAPEQEQTYRAKKLYVSQGASPWPYCGRKLSQ